MFTSHLISSCITSSRPDICEKHSIETITRHINITLLVSVLNKELKEHSCGSILGMLI